MTPIPNDIIEGNGKIAELDNRLAKPPEIKNRKWNEGAVWVGTIPPTENSRAYTLSDLQYHKDYNWLIPFIEQLKVSLNIQGLGIDSKTYSQFQVLRLSILNSPVTTSLEYLWLLTVKLVSQYHEIMANNQTVKATKI